ncbi:carboxypeptidase-like regulatory domain-containing protein [Hymenobacter sp. UYCo722]|uniref:carboxypeptidase-like regulatory domain-containing protein n=1 Tax=Hymenobacter sp. UYCo722 TaxID=3156335 RepID=UPI00339634CB
MRPATSLTIPQPCSESWAAMLPTAAGRQCAACAHTVVDFTLKTDAEILAYLAGAEAGRTCGRFAAGQLERPLQRAALAAPSQRWRAWLAAAVAVWAVREGIGTEANAQTLTEWRARYWGGPVPAAPVIDAPIVENVAVTAPAQPPMVGRETLHGVPIIRTYPEQLPLLSERPLVLRGIITDSANNEGIPGVTVLLKGTTVGFSTTATGSYEMTVPAELAQSQIVTLVLSSLGYLTQERTLANQTTGEAQRFRMQADNRMMGEVVVCHLPPRKLPPAPWHPRAFYFWGKYWLARPFRHH